MTNSSRAPVEPVLDLDDIQGIAVPGFLKQHQTLIGLALPSGAGLAVAKTFLGVLAGTISNGTVTLADRRARRVEARLQNKRHVEREGVVLVGLGCSAQGLAALTQGAASIASPAFRIGLAARSALLGDPVDSGNDGHPDNWIVGGPDNTPDLFLVLAGDHRAMVDKAATALLGQVAEAGLAVLYQEEGNVRDDEWDGIKMRGHEHFGFDDGISQPGIRGRASGASDDFITERHVCPEATPDTWLNGLPGQALVWPGEMVIGYPAGSPDPLLPGQNLEPAPDWTRNGSFLVFRRLRQDVGLFWRTMRDKAGELSALPGFDGMHEHKLASRVLGRWMSGAPVARAPDADDVPLGKQRQSCRGSSTTIRSLPPGPTRPASPVPGRLTSARSMCAMPAATWAAATPHTSAACCASASRSAPRWRTAMPPSTRTRRAATAACCSCRCKSRSKTSSNFCKRAG
jgi:deferrochelatase/peroxidase EfeB